MKIIKVEAIEIENVSYLFDKYRVFYEKSSDIISASAYLKERISKEEAVIFLAKNIENVPIGFILLYAKFSSLFLKKNWHINDLYVDVNHRKQGLGAKLLQTAIQFAKSNSATKVSLNTAIDNYSAQHLYESLGFLEKETTPGFLYYEMLI